MCICRYTKDVKQIILNKIEKVATYLVSIYNRDVADTDNFNVLYEYYKSTDRIITINSSTFDISEIVSYSLLPVRTPKLKGVDLLNMEYVCTNTKILLEEYTNKYNIYSNLRILESKGYHRNISYFTLNNSSVYIYSIMPNKLKKEYLKTLYNGKTILIIYKSHNYKLYDGAFDEGYFSILKLKNYPKSEWRQVIKEFQYVQSIIMKNVTNLDTLTIPQAWIDARKKARAAVLLSNNNGSGAGRKQKLEGEINYKKAVNLERYVQGSNCKFIPETIALAKLPLSAALYVYTTHENAKALNKLYFAFSNQKVKFITFSEREIKIIEKADIHNLMSYDKFMEGDCMPFRRVATAALIVKLKDAHRYAFGNASILSGLSNNLSKKIDQLTTYYQKNYSGSGGDIANLAILEVAEKYQLFDENIYSIYKEVKDILEKFPFINTLAKANNNRYSSGINEKEIVDILRDMLKYHKFKLDAQNYPIKKKEEKTEEEQSIELLNQLTN